MYGSFQPDLSDLPQTRAGPTRLCCGVACGGDKPDLCQHSHLSGKLYSHCLNLFSLFVSAWLLPSFPILRYLGRSYLPTLSGIITRVSILKVLLLLSIVILLFRYSYTWRHVCVFIKGYPGSNTSLLYRLIGILWASWGRYLFYFLPQCLVQGLE